MLALWALLPRNGHNRINTNAQLIPEVIEAEAELSTFSMGLEVAGLTEALSDDGPYTVFAPDNVAMAFALDDKYYQPEWSAHLTEIMLQHVSQGPAFETQFWQLGIEISPLFGRRTIGHSNHAHLPIEQWRHCYHTRYSRRERHCSYC